jgi:hypothetical protein
MISPRLQHRRALGLDLIKTRTDLNPPVYGRPINPHLLLVREVLRVELRLRCGSPEVCAELAEYVVRHRGVRVSQLSYEIRGGVLEISIAGPPSDVTASRRAVMEAYREWRSLREFRLGTSGRLDLRLLASTTGGPIMPDVLVELLRLRGYSAEVSGGELRTDANPEEVLELAGRVSRAIDEVSREFPKASRNLKHLLVATRALGLDPSRVLEVLRGRGLLEEGERRVDLRVLWRSLLAELPSLELGVGGVEAGGEEAE